MKKSFLLIFSLVGFTCGVGSLIGTFNEHKNYDLLNKYDQESSYYNIYDNNIRSYNTLWSSGISDSLIAIQKKYNSTYPTFDVYWNAISNSSNVYEKSYYLAEYNFYTKMSFKKAANNDGFIAGIFLIVVCLLILINTWFKIRKLKENPKQFNDESFNMN